MSARSERAQRAKRASERFVRAHTAPVIDGPFITPAFLIMTNNFAANFRLRGNFRNENIIYTENSAEFLGKLSVRPKMAENKVQHHCFRTLGI